MARRRPYTPRMRRTPACLFAAMGLALSVTAGCSSSGEVASSGTAIADATQDSGDVGPRVNEDHWHAAFDVYVCDEFVGPFSDIEADVGGLHSHGDGLVHIHPFLEEYSGLNATFGRFADQIGLGIEDGVMTVPEQRPDIDGSMAPETTTGMAFTEWSDGNSCPAGPGRVALFVWPPDAADDAEPEVVTSDVAGTRFAADGQRFVLAFAPADVVPPQPPSTPALEKPSDMG